MSEYNFTFENFTSNYIFENPWCMNVLGRFLNASIYMNILYDAIGIPLNAWILVAILVSTDLRARMRNKILACICAQGLFDSLILLPLSLYYFFDFSHYFSSCHTNRAHQVFLYFSEFISNWNLVTLLALFLFTLYGSSVTLGGRYRLITQVVTYSLLLWPWLFSAITIIPMILSLSFYVEFESTWNGETHCFNYIGHFLEIIFALNIGVPACLAAVLLAAIIFLKRKRSRDLPSRGDIARQLISDSSDSEPIIPYIAIVAIIFVCDFVKLYYFISIQWRRSLASYCTVKVLQLATELLEGARDVLLPLVLLLFPEVRCQTKRLVLRVWPGRRVADVTVVYVKDA